MSGKYYMGTLNALNDVTRFCASKVHDAAPGFAASGGPGKFNGESAFQKAGAKTTNVTLTGYQYKTSGTTTTVTAVKRGYYPTIEETLSNYFWWTGAAGTYNIVRTDSVLVIGNSTTFYPHDFRDGVIPSQVALFFTAGGSGGGGWSYYKKDKDNFPAVPGAGGGAGGWCLLWIDLTVSGTKVITVGAGGAAGSNGTSGKTSAGGAGGKGGESNYTVGGTKTLYAYSGVEGSAAKVSDGSYEFPGVPIGGRGCGFYSDTGKTLGVIDYWYGKGSGGTSAISTTSSQSNNALPVYKQQLMTDTGAPEVTLITAKNWASSNSTATIGSDTWFCGGNSYSAGAHYDGVGWYEYCSTPGGGGGGSGQLRCAGANGVAFLCY